VKTIVRILVIFLRLLALGFVLSAGWLAYTQYQQFEQSRAFFPAGSKIAGLPVGGLNQQQALDRLIQAYGVPVELRYGTSVIQAKPAALGFELDLTSMLAEAEVKRTSLPQWDAFWEYLWERKPGAFDIPLRARVDAERIRAYLKTEIAARYDQPAQVALPLPGSLRFLPARTGSVLDIEPAVPLINDALFSLTARTVTLKSSSQQPGRPALQNLQVLLRQAVDLSRFDGITEIYLQDMRTKAELHFAYQNGKMIPADIAFTAASTIKIPIMISTFRRSAEPTPPEVVNNLAKMIEISENDPADWLMKQQDVNNGPLEVTKDIQALGLKSTFLAGYFYPGAPLLRKISTPANTRKDYFTDPDPYNQTTPAEMGRLLADIYQCAADGGGSFAKVFPGQITQAECKQMIEYLVLNKLPVLITAGLPEGTRIAHKHGWIEELDGMVHTFSDAAIVFTPGGDYVLTVYLWKKNQLLFDTANALTVDLSQAVYNYFNYEVK
jgi:beta-lactamase class A